MPQILPAFQLTCLNKTFPIDHEHYCISYEVQVALVLPLRITQDGPTSHHTLVLTVHGGTPSTRQTPPQDSIPAVDSGPSYKTLGSVSNLMLFGQGLFPGCIGKL